VACEVEYTNEFEQWWNGLSEPEQISIASVVQLLAARDTRLGFPYSSGIEGSKFGHMRELRVQHAGDPYRVFYAFDPRRAAMLLIGGCKAGDDRFYERMVPWADRIYEAHLQELEKLSSSGRK
jgi:hypothetical protein